MQYSVVLFWVHWGVSICSAWQHLSGDELKKRLVITDYTLVAFVFPKEEKSVWLEPEWQLAVSADRGNLVSIECSGDAQSCHELGALETSEICLFSGQNLLSRYQGPRRASAILDFMARHKRPAVSEIQSGDVDLFQATDEVTFLACIDGNDSAIAASRREIYSRVAKRYREEFTFAILSEQATNNSQEDHPPAVRCHRKVDGETVTLSSFEVEEELDAWVTEASRPVIAELTRLNRQRLLNSPMDAPAPTPPAVYSGCATLFPFFNSGYIYAEANKIHGGLRATFRVRLQRGKPMIYIFSPSEAERADMRNRLAKLARSYYDSLTVVTADPFDFPDLVNRFGLGKCSNGHGNALSPSYPAGVVHQLSTDRIYRYPIGKALTSDALTRWGLSIVQGHVQPWTPVSEGSNIGEGKNGGRGASSANPLVGTKVATRRVSKASNIPGLKIRVAGRDEL